MSSNELSLSREDMEQIVLECIARLNEQREADEQLLVAPDAPIFGDDSPLDSLGLVTLTMDLEDAFADRGAEVSLSDAQAMSRRHSPYRNVPALLDFIEEQLQKAETAGG